MESVRTLEVHGHARAVRVLGSGPTALLLIHGLGSDGATWDMIAPRLAEKYTLIVPDLLGHGHSAKPRADYSIGGYANGMRDLLGLLGIERVTVVGHSFGGGVAMQFAYQFPERTDRLILVGCGGIGREVSVVLRALTMPGASLAVGASHLAPVGVVRAAVRTAVRLGLPKSLGADLDEAFTVHASLRDPAARAAFLHVLRHVVDWRGQLITMRDRAYLTEGLPTLIVWGEEDHVLPAGHADLAAALMSGSRTVVVPGVGHFPHREAPDAFVDAVVDFLDSSTPPPWDGQRWRRLLRERTTGPVANLSTRSNRAGRPPVSRRLRQRRSAASELSGTPL
jgi:pimeloyl-ACP methyl ester carboxylesterase